MLQCSDSFTHWKTSYRLNIILHLLLLKLRYLPPSDSLLFTLSLHWKLMLASLLIYLAYSFLPLISVVCPLSSAMTALFTYIIFTFQWVFISAPWARSQFSSGPRTPGVPSDRCPAPGDYSRPPLGDPPSVATRGRGVRHQNECLGKVSDVDY